MCKIVFVFIRLAICKFVIILYLPIRVSALYYFIANFDELVVGEENIVYLLLTHYL